MGDSLETVVVEDCLCYFSSGALEDAKIKDICIDVGMVLAADGSEP